MYEYKVKEVVRVVDGDTIDVFLDLGFNITVKKRIRLYGIDTPETRLQSKIKNVEERQAEKSRGLRSKEKLKILLLSAKELHIKSEGLGKYGRVLGVIKDQDGLCINDYMLEHGYATKM